jgi:glycosyltransferase involved in cell wall biosynthesis
VADDLPLLPPRGGVEDTRFIFSSRIAEHKGITILLDAVRLLVERGECKFSVDLYGPGKVPDILQRVHAGGLSGYIRYGGLLERNEMIARFASYDALTFPTWPREPLGLVPFEAAAQGCIPIMTAQAGAAEWLPTGDCIKIKRTPEGLAGGMQRVIHMPPEERRIMRQAISLNTRRFFSSNTWFPRIEQVTENLPRSAPRITAQTMRDAMFAITRMWRG